MKVRDVMSVPAVTITPDTSFPKIVDLLLARGISGVPVVDDEGRLLGVVSEADLVSKEAYRGRRIRPLRLVAAYLRGCDPRWVRKASGRRARDVMTRSVITAAPGDDLAVAARAMLENDCNRLPVVDDGRVVGVITRHDVIGTFHRTDDGITAEIVALLAHPMYAPDAHSARVTVLDGVVTLVGTARWPSDVEVIGLLVSRVPGVVAVDNQLHAREREPRVTHV